MMIFVAIFIKIGTMFYLKSTQLVEVIAFVLLLIIPLLALVRIIYQENIRFDESKIPKIMFYFTEGTIIALISAHITIVINNIAWILSGNPIVIENISSIGFLLLSVAVFIIINNLMDYEKLVERLAISLGFFNFVLIPATLIYLIASAYSGVFDADKIGYLELTAGNIGTLLPLLSILLVFRTNHEEELIRSNAIMKAALWSICVYFLAYLAISLTTSNQVAANTNGYIVQYFQKITNVNTLDFASYDFISILAFIQLLKSSLIILILFMFLKHVYQMHFVHIQPSDYLETTKQKEAYIKSRKRFSYLAYVLILIVLLVSSISITNLDETTMSMIIWCKLIINALIMIFIFIGLMNKRMISKKTKALAIYLTCISIVVMIFNIL